MSGGFITAGAYETCSLKLLQCILCSYFCAADYEYKYEVAKACFVKGEYTKAATLLGELLVVMKGTIRAEESLYLLAMSEYLGGDWEISSSYFKKYYQSYPKGRYVEHARYYAGKALFDGTTDPRLDQANTLYAIEEFQNFLDYYPYTSLKNQTQEMIFALKKPEVLVFRHCVV